ncbi:beta-ketoacyl synthase N-terminal-like domain-containing protein [Gynuella sunshinyii]|uniref:beta-ketoacyl synthase N-terminal-like domain-containing protein n=1 Tax=Gynuella sunshinyii TaxID=1445505 RepID=UPI00069AD155|nr:beta-ketoacyl synthase N-terminal-like domain-containing protein [Gynuella sunshinyii]
MSPINSIVIQAISAVTRMGPDDISNDATFESFGMDSVQLMELQSKLAVDFAALPKTILFEYNTVSSLVQYLTAQYPEQAGVVAETAVDSKPPAKEATAPRFTDMALPATGESRATVSIAHLFASAQPSSNRQQSVDAGNNSGIAVIGMAGRFPHADNLDTFWQNICNGRNCIDPIPAQRWDQEAEMADDHPSRLFSRWGGFVTDVEQFDHTFFQMSRVEAARCDPQLRLLLQTTWHALEDAGYTPASLEQQRVGVFVGAMNNDYSHVVSDFYRQQGLYAGAGSFDSELANQLSFFLNFHGPSFTIKSACASSLTALHLGCQAIRAGDCDSAIVAGVNLSLHPHKYRMLQDMKVLSLQPVERTFDAMADGLIPSEGIGVVLLTREAAARQANDTVHAVIRATAVSHAGRSTGQYLPNLKVMEATIRSAIESSGIDLDDLNYVESHGTATALGDPIELKALENVFAGAAAHSKVIGSKANLGHMESASGICALIKVILSMRHQTLAPCANLTDINSAIDPHSSCLALPNSAQPWPAGSRQTRVAGINSFGMGGSHAFAVVESPVPSVLTHSSSEQDELVVLSASTDEQLRQHARSLLAAVSDLPEHATLADIAWTSQVGRISQSRRLAIVCRTVAALQQTLAAWMDGESAVSGCYLGRGDQHSDMVALLSQQHGSDFIRGLETSRKLHDLARLWVNGMAINWPVLYADTRVGRVRLHEYAFQTVDCSLTKVLDELRTQIENKHSDYRKSLQQLERSEQTATGWYQVASEWLSISGKNDTQILEFWASVVEPKGESIALAEVLGKLSGDAPSEPLPEQTPRMLTQTFSAPQVQALMALSEGHQLELQTLVIAAWAIVLNRYTRTTAPLFALLPLTDTGAEGGRFPVAMTFTGRCPVSQWLQDLQAILDSCKTHSDLHSAGLGQQDIDRILVQKTFDDTAVLIGADHQMATSELPEGVNIAVQVGFHEQQLIARLLCAPMVDEDAAGNLLTNVCSIMQAMAVNPDRQVNAIPLAKNPRRTRQAMRHLEEVSE